MTDGQNAVTHPPRDAESIRNDAAATATKRPPGTVERALNCKERTLIIEACRQYCRKDGKGDSKAQSRLYRTMQIISYQEAVDYFAGLEDKLEDMAYDWQRAKNTWVAWKNYLSGALTMDAVKKMIPRFDESRDPEKPSHGKPMLTSTELRGETRPYYFPSKIDAWLQDILKAVNWDPLHAEFVTELCGKFGIKEDD